MVSAPPPGPARCRRRVPAGRPSGAPRSGRPGVRASGRTGSRAPAPPASRPAPARPPSARAAGRARAPSAAPRCSPPRPPARPAASRARRRRRTPACPGRRAPPQPRASRRSCPPRSPVPAASAGPGSRSSIRRRSRGPPQPAASRCRSGTRGRRTAAPAPRRTAGRCSGPSRRGPACGEANAGGQQERAGSVVPARYRCRAGTAAHHTTPGVSISSDPTDRPAVRGPSADGVPAVPGTGSGGVVDPTPVVPPQAAPADGLPPAGTPSPDGAGVPLAGLHVAETAEEHRSGAEVVVEGEHHDGGVSLVAKVRAVLRIRDFRKLWLSMSLSSFGDWLGLLAITATATSLVDSFAGKNYALGAVLLFRLLPAIVLGPLAGAFADRFDRRKTVVISDVLRFALFASIPLVDQLVWLFIAQFLIEAISLFWIPAKEAAVPNMLRRDQLEPANQLSLVTTYGLTPVLAAVAFAVLTTVGDRLGDSVPSLDGSALALYLNALTFLVAAVVIWSLPSISGRRAAGTQVAGTTFLGSLREGFSFAGHTPLVRGLVVGITGAFVAAGVVIATGQAFASSVGGGEAAYGLLFGAVFIGLGLGIALGPSIARDLSRERLFGISIVGAGAVVVLLAWTFTLWLALLLVVLMGFFAGIAYLAGFTLLGTEVDDALR